MKQDKRDLNFSYLLYNFILTVKFLEVVIKEFIKFVLLSKDPQERRFFWERLGILSNVTKISGKGRWLWVHANSIGDVNACQSLIRLIKAKYPARQILLTTSNFPADKRAVQLDIADAVMFFPYDIPFIIKRYLEVFKPVCIIDFECDIWPNFVKICKNRGIPVSVVSGTYTNVDSRCLRSRYLFNYTFRLSHAALENIDCFCMQTEEDAKRISAVIPGHKNISVTGNLKFSHLNNKSCAEEKSYYQRLFKIKENAPVFIAGNVHLLEDEKVIDAFKLVKEKIPNALMIFAPRFMEDVSSVESLLSRKRLSYVKKTNLDRQQRAAEDVVLLDTIGELAKVYAVTEVAFVGGSLVYLGEMFGGHNILEPAQFEVPVMFGPHMHNFQRLADLFLNEQIGIEVRDADSLARNIIELMQSRTKREATKAKMKQVLNANSDVAEKTFNRLLYFLNDYPGSCEVCSGENFRFLVRQDRFKIFRCQDCRLVFSHPIPSIEELNAFYQNLPYNQFESMYVKENAEIGAYVTKAQLKLLRRLGEDIPGGRFLDIGCGNGHYLYGAKLAGFQATGVEKDKTAAEYARRNYDVNVFSGDLEECNFPNAYFDIIKMRQFIEHLRHPNKYLQEVCRILRPGGILIVETVNTDSLETIPRLYFLDAFKKIESNMPELPLIKKIFISLRREWAFTDPPRHLYGFAKDNLKMLLTKNGFYCLQILTAVMGDKVHYPISQGHLNFLLKSEQQALKRLRGKSWLNYCVYRFILKPTMQILRLYIKLFGLGSHLIVYAKKKG